MGSNQISFAQFLSDNHLTVEEAKSEYKRLLPEERDLRKTVDHYISNMIVLNDRVTNELRDYQRLQMLKRFKEEGAWQD